MFLVHYYLYHHYVQVVPVRKFLVFARTRLGLVDVVSSSPVALHHHVVHLCTSSGQLSQNRYIKFDGTRVHILRALGFVDDAHPIW